jgi:hypothetical protein
MLTYWWCLHCAETGQYDHTAKGEMTAKGTAGGHTKTHGHTTVTSLHPPKR